MVSKVVRNLRLIVGVLALLWVQSGFASLVLIATQLQDFQIVAGEGEVAYSPAYHDIVANTKDKLQLKGGGTHAFPASDFYLTRNATVSDQGTSGMFFVEEKLSTDDSLAKRLSGVLTAIDSDGTGFRFLVDDVEVSSEFAARYDEFGVLVAVRVVGIEDKNLAKAYGVGGANGLLAEPAGESKSGPSIPIPSTVLLFLVAGIPLVAAWCLRQGARDGYRTSAVPPAF